MINFLKRYTHILFFIAPMILLAHTPPTEADKNANPPIKEIQELEKDEKDNNCIERIKEKQKRIKSELDKLRDLIKTRSL